MTIQLVLEYGFYLLAGILAGVINTLAGGASVFTLSILLFFGMPAGIANGTNRLGILFQNFAGTITFYRNGLLDLKASMPFVIPSLIGAVTGALIAVDLDAKTMEHMVGTLMIFMLFTILKKPKSKVIRPQQSRGNKILNMIVFFAIGLYGGFVQAGIGLVLIVALTQMAHFSLIRGNAIKMIIIFLYTVPVMGIFIYKGQIEWMPAIWLAVGQVLGTHLTSKFAVKSSGESPWIRMVLVAMVVLSILKTFGIFEMGMDYLSGL